MLLLVYYAYCHCSVQTAMKHLLSIFALFLITSRVYAQPFVFDAHTPLVPDAPTQYVVQEAEQWSDILSKIVLDPEPWLQRWQGRLPKLGAGDVILLEKQGNLVSLTIRQGRTVKLQPRVRVVEGETVRSAPILPVEAIQQFLNRPSLLTEQERETAGYVIANSSKSLMSSLHDRIFVRNLSYLNEEQFIVVRPGQRFASMDGEVVYAYEAIYLGDAEWIEDAEDGVSTLRLTHVVREVLKGDLVIPVGTREFRENFELVAAPEDLVGENAYIVAVVDGVSQIGQYNVVVVNLGENDGLVVGHLLNVKQRGGSIVDDLTDTPEMVRLPDQQAGTLLIFRVFDTISYALVIKAILPINLFDPVTAP
ncbi:hypothetical protein [Thioflexithrix psekupsensis]|uniref:Peptidoglycan-binding protein n=1 Tax=Thioflexithrix psekupsensis TaxID=1570016 RepID=A0A251XA71_9GAMM|nr:hypothetical protein [Thioflexithrix psekupsensis]OUD15332.1 hypothetical protein TPSD3_02035 [Thioflexithrix psekupsensis]